MFVLTKYVQISQRGNSCRFEILSQLQVWIKHITTTKNVTYHMFWCFNVLIKVFQKIGKKFQLTEPFIHGKKLSKWSNLITWEQLSVKFSAIVKPELKHIAVTRNDTYHIFRCFNVLIEVFQKDWKVIPKNVELFLSGKNCPKLSFF